MHFWLGPTIGRPRAPPPRTQPIQMLVLLATISSGCHAALLRPTMPPRSRTIVSCEYEAKNPIVKALGQFLPSFSGDEEATAAAAAPSPLDEIDWAKPKRRGLSTAEMASALDAGLREREWFVTGRGLPELFSDSFFFSDPDVSLSGIEPYCRQVNRLFNQETSRAEIVCCSATGANAITVVWRNSGGINIGPGVAIKPYIVTTTLKTDPNDGGLISFQEDEFAIPGWDILISALLPPLRSLPFIAPEAPPVEVLRQQYDPISCKPLASSTTTSSSSGVDDEIDPATKSVWFATELFGQITSTFNPPPPPPPTDPPPKDLDESIARLVADYEGTEADPRPYFLTGRMDIALYDPECEFSDPFVAFNGRERFVNNLNNLAGGFITESSTRTLESSVNRGDPANGVPPTYTTRLMVKLRLGLPWSPVLAWPWGVTHEFDAESGLIVRHIESWDVSGSEGVRQLLSGGAEKRV